MVIPCFITGNNFLQKFIFLLVYFEILEQLTSLSAIITNPIKIFIKVKLSFQNDSLPTFNSLVTSCLSFGKSNLYFLKTFWSIPGWRDDGFMHQKGMITRFFKPIISGKIYILWVNIIFSYLSTCQMYSIET